MPDSEAQPAHFLAYGNSNQAVLRSEATRSAYDGISIPGTIATYFQQATGGFVLALNKPYFLDPRTPLFQCNPDKIRASFYTLSSALGPEIEGAVSRAGSGSANLWNEVRSSYRPRSAATSWLDYQRQYVAESSERLDHYSHLIGRPLSHVQRPHFFTNPYWMSDGIHSEGWGMTHDTIVEMVEMLEPTDVLVPIVAWHRSRDADWGTLRSMILQIRDLGLSRVFVWVDSFREQEEPAEELRNLRDVVVFSRNSGVSLGMLYGGYFSLLLGAAGLWAFGNGVGYSENRAFPELPSTGAPPPRYYMYRLHCYLPADTASQLLTLGLEINLDVPSEHRTLVPHEDPAALDYKDLMTHFVLARGAELTASSGRSMQELSDELYSTADHIESHPRSSRLVKNVDYLRRWAEVLMSSD